MWIDECIGRIVTPEEKIIGYIIKGYNRFNKKVYEYIVPTENIKKELSTGHVYTNIQLTKDNRIIKVTNNVIAKKYLTPIRDYPAIPFITEDGNICKTLKFEGKLWPAINPYWEIIKTTTTKKFDNIIGNNIKYLPYAIHYKKENIEFTLPIIVGKSMKQPKGWQALFIGIPTNIKNSNNYLGNLNTISNDLLYDNGKYYIPGWVRGNKCVNIESVFLYTMPTEDRIMEIMSK